MVTRITNLLTSASAQLTRLTPAFCARTADVARNFFTGVVTRFSGNYSTPQVSLSTLSDQEFLQYVRNFVRNHPRPVVLPPLPLLPPPDPVFLEHVRNVVRQSLSPAK